MFIMNCQMKFFLVLIVLISFQSCSKIINIPPPLTSLTEDNIYTNDETAISVLSGIYSEMSYSTKGLINFTTGVESFSLITGLSSDELEFV